LNRLKSTHTTDSKLCSTLDNTHDAIGASGSIGIEELVIRDPARVMESITDAFSSRRDDACVTIGTLPSGCGEAGHDAGSSACLATEGWSYASAVLAGGERLMRVWGSTDKAACLKKQEPCYEGLDAAERYHFVQAQ